MKNVYRFTTDSLNGFFVADDADVAALVGKTIVYDAGATLGTLLIQESFFISMSSRESFVTGFATAHPPNGSTGFNPFKWPVSV